MVLPQVFTRNATEEDYEDIHFILSKDTKMSPNFMKKHGIPERAKKCIEYVYSYQSGPDAYGLQRNKWICLCQIPEALR